MSTLEEQIALDEALARSLFEQEQDSESSNYKCDEELAIQLEREQSSNVTTDLLRSESDLMYDRDFQLALQLSSELNSKEDIRSKDFALAKQLNRERFINEDILKEEIPDLQELFLLFNRLYFDNKLNMVEVRWSTKMTSCAGTCSFKPLAGHCIIALSEPLLKFRPKSDMIETLLHEMIHALHFITRNITDRDGHGPAFIAEASRINKLANVNITIYHNFHSEVDHYHTHVWQCNGICADRPPYFGIVKRAMNRPPQKADFWFAEHQRTCGGTFIKVSAPESESKKRKKSQSNTLLSYFENGKDSGDGNASKNKRMKQN